MKEIVKSICRKKSNSSTTYLACRSCFESTLLLTFHFPEVSNAAIITSATWRLLLVMNVKCTMLT